MRVVRTAAGQLGAIVGWSLGVIGAWPAGFGCADEAVLDFGDSVSDEPGFVTMSQPVKRESGPHRICSFAVVAVDRGAEHAAVEVAASERVAQWAGENEIAVAEKRACGHVSIL